MLVGGERLSGSMALGIGAFGRTGGPCRSALCRVGRRTIWRSEDIRGFGTGTAYLSSFVDRIFANDSAILLPFHKARRTRTDQHARTKHRPVAHFFSGVAFLESYIVTKGIASRTQGGHATSQAAFLKGYPLLLPFDLFSCVH